MSGGKAQRETRIRFNLPVALEMEDGSRVEARLLDLSSQGFRIQSEELLQEGERVVLRMEGDEPMPAEIKWATGFIAGGTFLNAPPTID